MSETQDTRTAEEIEADLARTREQLGDTVEQLAAKVDVKTRSKRWLQDTKVRTQTRTRSVTEQHGRELAIGGAAVAGLVLAVVVWRVRSR